MRTRVYVTLDEAQRAMAAMESWDGNRRRVTECANCGHPIAQLMGGRWRHLLTTADAIAGCRAASFTEDLGWDESIPRGWSARPGNRK